MILSLLLIACIPIDIDPGNKDGGGDNGGGADDPFVIDTFAAVSDRNGTFEVRFDIPESKDVFQVVAMIEGNKYIATEYLFDPRGEAVVDWEDWYGSAESLTEAVYPTQFATTLNWPSRPEDGPLQAGEWTFAGATVNLTGNYQSDIEVEVKVLSRPDPDFGAGNLDVVIAYAGGLEGDPEVVRGIEAGVEYWRELYAQWGVTLGVEYTTLDIDPALPDTYEGVDEYETLLANWDGRVNLMVIGDDIAGDRSIFGEAGGIPGPYWAQPHAAVEVSWLAHAGGNGEFSDDEIMILGETMGHEMGHFLGLFHPVEYEWQYWDALDDTAHCSSMSNCENQLGDNIMFPYPICYGRDCLRQDTMSDDQMGVLNRYVGVE